MPNTISSRQMFFILFLTLTCYSVVVISKEMAQSAGTGAWITVLITCLVFALAAAAIAYLNKSFIGQTLVEYAPGLISKAGTYIITVYYVIYYIFILVFLTTGVATLFKEDFFINTPLYIFPALFIPLVCFIAYKGVTNVARLVEILGIAFIITAIFVHISMMTQGRVNRILPLFNPGEIEKYVEGFKFSIFPFLGIEVLFIMPFAQKKGSKPIKTAFLSLLAVGLFYIFVIESCIMKLGINDIVNYKDSLIVAIRDTAPKAIEFLERLDILYLTVGFAGLFMGMSVVALAITEFLCRAFKIKRLFAVIAVGAITFISFMLVKGIKGYEDFSQNVGTIIGVGASLVIPAVLLVIAKIKKAHAGAKPNG